MTVTSVSPKETLKILLEEEVPAEDICVREVSNEEDTVTESETYEKRFKEEATYEEMVHIEKVMKENGAKFTSPNIQLVSYSPVKSVRYGKEDFDIKQEGCILVLVDVKLENGQIPIGYDNIPEFIEDVRTDIREGYVMALMNSSSHDMALMNSTSDQSVLKMGHKISVIKGESGSLGPFIDLTQDDVGFLTSLHVFLSPKEYENLKHQNVGQPMTSHEFSKSVYQLDYSDEEVGNEAFLYFSEGDKNSPGYEVVLVKVHKPEDASCVISTARHPETSYSPEYPFEFRSGEPTTITKTNRLTKLEKYGAATGYTTGQYAGPISECTIHDSGFKIKLYNQMLVRSISKDKRLTFAMPGDSGAPVLTRERENGTLKIVGIITAQINKGKITVITPIMPILAALGKTQCKIFV